MTDNALMRPPQTTWTNIPPAMSGRQIEGTSLLPFGLYSMPDGSQQASFGLPQPLLDAYRSMMIGSGMEQDPNAPPGFMSVDQIARGAQGLGSAAMTGGMAASTAAGPAGAVVGSGLLGNLRNKILKSMRDSRANHAQRRVDEAAGLGDIPQTGQLNVSKADKTFAPRIYNQDPGAQIAYYAERGYDISQIAEMVGQPVIAVARAARNAKGPSLPNPAEARSQAQALNRIRSEAKDIISRFDKGQKGQRSLDDIARRNSDQQQVSQDVPDQISGPSNTADTPPPTPTPPKAKPAPIDKEKFWGHMEGRAEQGIDVPGKGKRIELNKLREELKAEGIDISLPQLRARLNDLRNSGTSGADQANFIRQAGPKGADRLRSTGVPIPQDEAPIIIEEDIE